MEKHRPTEKVLDILELLMTSEEGYTFSEISNKLSIPRGSLFPVLHTLNDRKFIKHNSASQRYTLGIKCYEIGNFYISHININDEIYKIVKKVVKKCGETCHFAVLDGRDAVYLFKEESDEPVRMVSSAGKRIPAHSTAIGKALLSGYSNEKIMEMYDGNMEKLTENTIVDVGALISQIEKVRVEKMAYETEESSMNVTCIAVTIEKNGEVVAALSASIPIFRATEEKIENIKNILSEGRIKIEEIIKSGDFNY